MITVKLSLPATREMWLALRVDDKAFGNIASSFRDGEIHYTVVAQTTGDAKSAVNDILRCYAALTSVLDTVNEITNPRDSSIGPVA